MSQFERLFATSGFSLERMRSFLEVVEAGSISRAAKGDPTRQSQFSRQIKELESFFGVALTRRVGRRVSITEEGQRLALLIRRQFSELDDFREAMAGRSVSVRLGGSGSVLQWMVTPKLAECQKALGEVTFELEQSRSADVVRGVADGRLDFGIVRGDAVPDGMKGKRLGEIGYALFAPKTAWKKGVGVSNLISQHPFGELLPGGQFQQLHADWIDSMKVKPKVAIRAGSFLQLASLVGTSGIACVLPESAAAGFDSTKVKGVRIQGLPPRQMAFIANKRSLERVGVSQRTESEIVSILAWEPESSRK